MYIYIVYIPCNAKLQIYVCVHIIYYHILFFFKLPKMTEMVNRIMGVASSYERQLPPTKEDNENKNR